MSDERKNKPNSFGKSGLTELGYQERRAFSRRERPGTIGFDELGNAQYQWSNDALMEDGDAGESRRQRALSVANLVLVDDEPPSGLKAIGTNKNGLRLGYNPYDSGQLKRQDHKKPRDLRALSKWIEAQRLAGKNTLKQQEDDKDALSATAKHIAEQFRTRFK